MEKKNKSHSAPWYFLKNLLALTVIFGLPYWAYHSCTSGYEHYGYFVHAGDERAFNTNLSSAGPHIVEHGRRLLEGIAVMDNAIDGGDGAATGKLRWYTCSGIDCDEGWETSFLKMPVGE